MLSKSTKLRSRSWREKLVLVGGRVVVALTDVVVDCSLSITPPTSPKQTHIHVHMHIHTEAPFHPPFLYYVPLSYILPSFLPGAQKRCGWGRGHEEPTRERTDVTCLLHHAQGSACVCSVLWQVTCCGWKVKPCLTPRRKWNEMEANKGGRVTGIKKNYMKIGSGCRHLVVWCSMWTPDHKTKRLSVEPAAVKCHNVYEMFSSLKKSW